MATTAALVIVLSVFNGLQEFIGDNYNRFNPPFKIEAKEGKLFSYSEFQAKNLTSNKVAEVRAVEPVICDLVLVTYNDKQTLATLYGVSETYPDLTGLSAATIDGDFNTDTENGIVFGAGIAGFLGIDMNSYIPVQLFYPKRNKKSFVNPMDAFKLCNAYPVGVFASNTTYDENSLFVSQTFAKELLDYDNEVSFLAVFPNEKTVSEKFQKKLTQIVGDEFIVQNHIQQEALMYKTIKAENLMVYLILGFIFILATFNIVGILGMLIVEKKQDISILHTLGASKALLKKVFLFTGAMVGIFGGLFGMCIGLICCLIQQFFGVISLGTAESSFLLTAYPVAVYFTDFLIVFSVVTLISLLTSVFSLRGLKNNYLFNKY